MHCINCGEKLTSDARFCPECGHRVEASSNTSTSRENMVIAAKKGKPLNMKFIIPIILVGVIVVGSFFLLGSKAQPHDTVYTFFESAMKAEADKFLDTLAFNLRNELMDEMEWNMREMASSLGDINEGMAYELGSNWVKQLNIETTYEDGNSAIVGVSIKGMGEEELTVRLFKEDKKWVIIDFPWWELPW